MIELITIRLRLKDKHSSELRRQARAVNTVWNYANEMQIKAVRAQRKWLTGFDLVGLTSGSSQILGLHGHTISRVCLCYAQSRKTHNLPWLRFRSAKSLGWVPFNQSTVRFDGQAFVFRGVRYETMHARDIPSQPTPMGIFTADIELAVKMTYRDLDEGK